jgi:hypothetical protein
MRRETALWNVTIRPNTSALLSLTTDEGRQFTIQGKSLDESSILAKQSGERGRMIYRIPAGSFSFVVDK